MTGSSPIEHWPVRLEAVVRQGAHWGRVFVLRETGSTQDAAREAGARAGDVFVAWRQTAGRGRFGRAWLDTAQAGVALTLAVPRGAPERRAIAAAIGVAHALELPSLLGRPVGIKWPNDIVIGGRKLGGILIEQTGDVALVGIGVNVHQTDWPRELAAGAVSLAQLGAPADRLAVIEAILLGLDKALDQDEAEVAAEFASRDVLRGTTATLRCGRETLRGMVVRIDPTRGLLVRTQAGERWLPAATTSLAAIPKPLPVR